MESFGDLIRQKYPGLAKKAAGNSLKTAIHLFCLECMGLDRKSVYSCTCTGCFLWPHRPQSRARSTERIQEQESTSETEEDPECVAVEARSYVPHAFLMAPVERQKGTTPSSRLGSRTSLSYGAASQCLATRDGAGMRIPSGWIGGNPRIS